MVLCDDRKARLGGEKEIPALDEADRGPVVADRQRLADRSQERDAMQRDGDIGGIGELLADRGGGQRARREGEGRILLDEQHAAREARMRGDVMGRRGAMHGAADDDHVIGAHRTHASRTRHHHASMSPIPVFELGMARAAASSRAGRPRPLRAGGRRP